VAETCSIRVKTDVLKVALKTVILKSVKVYIYERNRMLKYNTTGKNEHLQIFRKTRPTLRDAHALVCDLMRREQII
jgi:hypothetical protein